MERSSSRAMKGAAAVALILAALLAAPLWAQAQSTIVIGPYVQNVGATNATICWATVSGEVAVTPPAGNDASFREYETHSVLLRSLQPGTSYTYSVPGDTGDAGRCTFTTAAAGEHPFSFAIISDTQNRGNPAHRPIIERIMAGKPDLLFNVGDLVSDGRSIGDWEEFFRVEGDLLRAVPCYAVLGNHERSSALYFQFFALPGNERYYSFDRGTAHFVVFDSPGLYVPEDNQSRTQADRQRFQERQEQYWQQQMQWLKDDLAGHPEAKYVFVFFHYPVYSLEKPRVAQTDEFRARCGTVFQDYNVTAVFNGHDHHYHREIVGGVQFVDGGVAGGKARPIDAPILPETVKYARVESFTWVDVGADQARVHVTDVAGNTVDEFVLAPRPQPAPGVK